MSDWAEIDTVNGRIFFGIFDGEIPEDPCSGMFVHTQYVDSDGSTLALLVGAETPEGGQVLASCLQEMIPWLRGEPRVDVGSHFPNGDHVNEIDHEAGTVTFDNGQTVPIEQAQQRWLDGAMPEGWS